MFPYYSWKATRENLAAEEWQGGIATGWKMGIACVQDNTCVRRQMTKERSGT
jgi:hypothetical protein